MYYKKFSENSENNLFSLCEYSELSDNLLSESFECSDNLNILNFQIINFHTI
jgi:hypothetical protein